MQKQLLRKQNLAHTTPGKVWFSCFSNVLTRKVHFNDFNDFWLLLRYLSCIGSSGRLVERKLFVQIRAHDAFNKGVETDGQWFVQFWKTNCPSLLFMFVSEGWFRACSIRFNIKSTVSDPPPEPLETVQTTSRVAKKQFMMICYQF